MNQTLSLVSLCLKPQNQHMQFSCKQISDISLYKDTFTLYNMRRDTDSHNTMKFKFTLLCFICSITAAAVKHLSADSSAQVFENWMTKHGKMYQSLDEKQRRFDIFKENLKHIEETNSQRKNYRLGLNEFADMHHEEFKRRYLGLKGNFMRKSEATLGDSTNQSASYLPKFVDWRNKGAVTPVKNQGTCGKFLFFIIALFRYVLRNYNILTGYSPI